MLETYRKYYFVKRDSIEQLQQEYKANDIIILEDTNPISGIIGYKDKSKASYSHILTQEELKSYLKKSTHYEDNEEFLLKRTVRLSKFAISKNEKLPNMLALPFTIILIEILLITYLVSIPILKDKGEDLFILLLEIIGTTLTFFFSFLFLEEESHALLLESHDEKKNSEIRFINKTLSFCGLALFIIGFFLHLHSVLS